MLAAKVPAWKRLGLKLKGPAGAAGGENNSGAAAQAATPQKPTANSGGVYTPNSSNKRRPDYDGGDGFGSNKKAKFDSNHHDSHQNSYPQGRRKSVTFAEGTKGSDHFHSTATKTPSKPPSATSTEDRSRFPNQSGAAKAKAKREKKKKDPNSTTPRKKPDQSAGHKPAHLQPQLSGYLKEWRDNREGWKFRKNIQTLLIKYAFDPELLPAAEFPVFLSYARDLKGASRKWLTDSAAELCEKDAEGPTKEAATKGAKKATAEEEKQKQYESLLATMLEPQPRTALAGRKRTRADYSEMDFVMGGTPEADEAASAAGSSSKPAAEVTQRLVKRMRAEMVLDELPEAEVSDASTSTAASGTTTSSGSSGGKDVAKEEGEGSSSQPSGGEAKKARLEENGKRVRQRKKRTVADSDTSSDESSSDESSGEEEEDDEGGAKVNGADETSSSSSSSGSGSDSDSDEDEESAEESEGALRQLGELREQLDSSSSSSSSSDEASSSGSDDDDEEDL